MHPIAKEVINKFAKAIEEDSEMDPRVVEELKRALQDKDEIRSQDVFLSFMSNDGDEK